MHVLIRFSGEVTTKAKRTRARFTQRLARNIEDTLRSEGIESELKREWSRFFVEIPDADRSAALAALQRVFGIQSFSKVERRLGGRLEEVVRAGEELFKERVRGKRFAVRARCGGDRSKLSFGSKAIEIELGSALLPYAHQVDLDNPEVTAHVEVRDGRAYFFTEQLPGPGGLPLGTEGRAVALVSGGFDSAVAAWLMLKRGVALDYVFCNLGGAAHLQGVLRVLKIISDRWSYGDRPTLHVLDFQPLVKELQSKTKARYWQVLLKRLMVRAAERVARESRGRGIVTGEALGQVSSQTLPNLDVISQVTRMSLLRPLLGFDKEEIIARARRIGTYELSAAVDEYCALVPSRPATRASLQDVLVQEAQFDLDVLERIITERDVHDLRALDPETFLEPEFELEEIPEDATVIDVRTRSAYDSWHYPGAIHLEFFKALDEFEKLDRDKTYVVCCEVGLKSAHLAERMRWAGYRAYNFKGGMKNLVQYALERDLVPLEEMPSYALALEG